MIKPLVPEVETSSWSAQAFAIARRYEAVRQLERDFDAELEATIYDRAMDVARGLTDDEPTKVERKAITPGDDMP